jgi:hypothetical protein
MFSTPGGNSLWYTVAPMLVCARAVAFSLASLCVSVMASAQVQSESSLPSNTAKVRLSWFRAEGATSCIGVTALEQDVARRLSYNPFVGEPRQWIDGIVSVEAGQYVVRLFERDALGHTLGTRTLSDNVGDCRHLGEAVSLAIALIIDPSLPLSPLGQTPSLKVHLAQPPTEPLVPPTAREGTTIRNSDVPVPLPSVASTPNGQASSRDYASKNQNRNHSIALGSSVRTGLFPEAALGVELLAEGTVGALLPIEYRIGMAYFPEQKIRHALATLSYGLTAGVLGLCAKSRGELRGFGCMSLEGGALHTVVHDPNPVGPGDRAWMAARIELGLEWTVRSPLFIQLRALGAVPLTQWDFYTYLNGERHQSFSQPWLQMGAALGLGVRFF